MCRCPGTSDFSHIKEHDFVNGVNRLVPILHKKLNLSNDS